ncbi:MAG: hypothetical protein ACYC91_17090 [Solirubrobacteraceae bacterium]
MLPGVAVGALGALGITGSSALARTLSPVAQPLFVVSAALVLISALACSRLVVALSSAGLVLLYLLMFGLSTGGAAGDGSSMSMTAMHQPNHAGSTLHANVPTFYLGLVLLLSAVALRLWRRRRGQCRPVFRIAQLGAVRR